MSALTASPVRATAALASRKWGTEIDLDCRHTGYGEASTYALQVIDRAGATHHLGTWTLQPGTRHHMHQRTALPRDQISDVEITRPDGTAILHLTI